MEFKSVLIIGIDSGIGAYLRNYLKSLNCTVYGTTRRLEFVDNQTIWYLDLSKPKDFQFSKKIDLVVFCACETKISKCRDLNAELIMVNQDSPAIITKSLYQFSPQLHVLYLSTSAVFDGTKPKNLETDKVSPKTNYGRLKANAEQQLLDLSNLNCTVTILRLTKVLIPNYPLIINWIYSLKINKPIKPFYDLYLCPVSINQVLLYIKKIIEIKPKGIVHVSEGIDMSYYDLSVFLIHLLKIKSGQLIEPCSALANGVDILEAPRYSSLSSIHKDIYECDNKITFTEILRDLYGDKLCNA